MSEADSDLIRRLLPVVERFMQDVAFLGPFCPLWCREIARQLGPILEGLTE